MGPKKIEFMKAASKLVADSLSKPESYVGVCVQDGLDLIWGGEDTPAALCTLNSIGAINLANNKSVSEGLCTLFEDFGIPADRYYINFTDFSRENVAYNGATFAG
eukprot:gene21617-26001_t